MDLFILNPIKQVTKNINFEQFKRFNKIIVDNVVKPLDKVELLDNSSEKILVIDPDFVKWSLGKKELCKIKNIKKIIVTSTAYDWVDIGYLNKKGIEFSNVENFSSQAVSDWGVMMMLILARKVPLLMKNKVSEDLSQSGVDLQGKKFGIIGLGNIGSAFARKVEPYAESISYWSRNKKDVKYAFTTIDMVMKNCNIIYLSYVTPEGKDDVLMMKNAQELKKEAIVICARKPSKKIHDYLIKGVEEGDLGGYGFESGYDFHKYKGNVWAGPIMGWATEETFYKNWNLTMGAILSS